MKEYIYRTIFYFGLGVSLAYASSVMPMEARREIKRGAMAPKLISFRDSYWQNPSLLYPRSFQYTWDEHFYNQYSKRAPIRRE